MQCPECGSTSISKNGQQRGKQNYLCKACRRQFIETYDPPSPYADEFKRECLKLYVNGMGFRGIERVKGVHHAREKTRDCDNTLLGCIARHCAIPNP